MERKTFSLAFLGLSQHEQRVLTSLCWLSSSRSRSYTSVAAYGPKDPEVLVVDGDDPKALGEWQNHVQSRREQGKTEIPAVLVSKESSPDDRHFRARRPLVAARLLKVLDAVTEHLQTQDDRLAIREASPSRNEDRLTPTEDAQHSSRSRDASGVRVLVVDDSLPVRKQLQLELERHGVSVEFAERGEQALHLLKTRRFHLVFLDVVLPGIDGYQVCKSIKRDKSLKHIPVIMLTGKSSPFDHVKGALAGADSYLNKPVKKSTFDATVSHYLTKVVTPTDQAVRA